MRREQLLEDHEYVELGLDSEWDRIQFDVERYIEKLFETQARHLWSFMRAIAAVLLLVASLGWFSILVA